MKWLALLLLLPSMAFAQTTYTLHYKNTNGRYPVCSTIKIWCGTGVFVGELLSGNWAVIGRHSLSSSSHLFPTYPTAGPHIYGVWVSYKDGNGVLQQTVIDQATVIVPPGQ